MSQPRRPAERRSAPRRPPPAFAAEDRMLADADHHVEIAGGCAVGAGLTLAGELEAVAVLHPGGIFRDRSSCCGSTGAPALRTRVLDDLAFALAVRQDASGEEALLEAHLAAAATGAAVLWRGAGLGTAAVAVAAALVAGNLDLGLQAEGRLLETDRQVVAQVVAAPPRPPRRPVPKMSPKISPNRSSKGCRRSRRRRSRSRPPARCRHGRTGRRAPASGRRRGSRRPPTTP